MLKKIILVCFILTTGTAIAQDLDTIITQSPVPLSDLEAEETKTIESYKQRYNPQKASLYAAILPGLGQIYNKKYWKLPLVYGGFYAAGYAFNFYQGLYTDYKSQLFEVIRTGENSTNPGIGESVLRPAIDKARRERDFMVIVLAGVYILQIIDAHVDAHLKEFDFNPNLQVKLRPSFENDPALGQMAGFSLSFRL